MRVVFLLLMVFFSSVSYGNPVGILTPITSGEKQKLEAFVNGRPLESISDYHSPHLDSVAHLENFLFRKAVLLGGMDARFEDFITPNSARARELLRNGTVLAGGTAQWHVYYPAFQDQVFESDVIIQSGWYEKGLYTTKNNLKNYSVRTLGDLSKLSAVTSKTWEVDWAILSGLNLAALFPAPTRPLQFRMIEGKRADFTLQDFSALPDLSIEEQGVTLYPIPGVKIALPGTRHFWVYKHHPDSKAVFESLQKGLRIMQQRGEIKRALSESGVRNKVVENWTVLNPE